MSDLESEYRDAVAKRFVVTPYHLAEDYKGPVAGLAEVRDSVLVARMKEIIAAEAPIRLSTFFPRVSNSFKGRATERGRERIRQYIAQAGGWIQYQELDDGWDSEDGGEWVWANGQVPEEWGLVRSREYCERARLTNQIPLEEFLNAICVLVKTQRGVYRDQVTEGVKQLLGFDKKNEEFESRVYTAADLGIERGWLIENINQRLLPGPHGLGGLRNKIQAEHDAHVTKPEKILFLSVDNGTDDGDAICRIAYALQVPGGATLDAAIAHIAPRPSTNKETLKDIGLSIKDIENGPTLKRVWLDHLQSVWSAGWVVAKEEQVQLLARSLNREGIQLPPIHLEKAKVGGDEVGLALVVRLKREFTQRLRLNPEAWKDFSHATFEFSRKPNPTSVIVTPKPAKVPPKPAPAPTPPPNQRSARKKKKGANPKRRPLPPTEVPLPTPLANPPRLGRYEYRTNSTSAPKPSVPSLPEKPARPERPELHESVQAVAGARPQPVVPIRKFSEKLDPLMGVFEEVLLDGRVDAEEAEYLKLVIEEHGLSNHPDVVKLWKLLQQVFEDGVVEESEADEILRMIYAMLSDPGRIELRFYGRKFIFVGETKREMEDLTKFITEMTGTVIQDWDDTVDYVIIGEAVDNPWVKFKDHTFIRFALNRRANGAHFQFVYESMLFDKTYWRRPR